MKADPAAQQRLLDLQAIDTAIGQIDHRIKTLPEHALVAALVQRRNELGQRYVAAQTEVSDAETAQAKAEADLEPVRQRLARNQERSDKGQVSDARALTSLQDEIAHLKKRIVDLEDLELEAMEALESSTRVRDGILAEKADLDAEARAIVAKRDSQTADLTAEREAQATKRVEVVASLPAGLVDLYEKVRARGSGAGAALLKARRCSGCGITADPSAYERYVSAAADEVLRCEECDRILVRDPADLVAG